MTLAALVAGLLALAPAHESSTAPSTYSRNDQIVASVISAKMSATTAERSSDSLRKAAKLVALGTSLLGTAALLRRS